jgi:hypothetical protein
MPAKPHLRLLNTANAYTTVLPACLLLGLLAISNTAAISAQQLPEERPLRPGEPLLPLLPIGAYPRQDGHRHFQMKRYRGGANGVHPENTTPTCRSPKVSYYGGPVISNVQPIAVFWGNSVNSAIVANMPQFLSDAGNSLFMDLISQYSTYGTTLGTTGTDQWIGSGSNAVKGYTIVPSYCVSGPASCLLSDTDIQNELNAQIAAGHLPAPTYDFEGNPNTVYLTYFPPYIQVDGPDGAGFSCVDNGFCAYHNTGTLGTGTTPLIYGVLMDEFTSACAQGCGGNSTALENQTDTSSHEFAESITDADIGLDTAEDYAYPAAWGDNSNDCGEIADICDSGGAGDTITVGGRSWIVQELWSNEDAQCESHGTFNPPYRFSAGAGETAGTQFTFTLTAENPTGGVNTGYTGTVHFTSTDPNATLPANYTFTTSNAGTATFNATFLSGGSEAIIATDTFNPNLTATSGPYTVTAPQIAVTVSASPLGASFSVDGTTYSGSHNFSWTAGTTHTLSTIVSQTAGPGAIYTFGSWSDGGALTHTVVASPSTTSYTVNFGLSYQLITAASPPSGGSVLPPSAVYYPAGDVVDLSATANSGFNFIDWSGPVASSTSSSTSVTMSAPETVTADFAPNLVVTTAVDDAGTASNCTPQVSPGTGTDASCSLRDALAAAKADGAGSITFDSTKFAAAQTITLGGAGTLNIPSNATVTGPTTGTGPSLRNLVTISGNSAFTVFTAGSGVTEASLNGLNITGGAGAGNGGGIVNAGALTVSNALIAGNIAIGAETPGSPASGGGIYNTGTLTLTNSTLVGNVALAPVGSGTGGGIQTTGNLTVIDSTISGNSIASSPGIGGGIATSGTASTLTIYQSTISGNRAATLGGGVYSTFNSVIGNTIISGDTGGDFVNSGGTYGNEGGNQIGVSGIGLAALSSYGGQTPTELPLPGSPAICGGSLANLDGTTTDQRGYPRTVSYGGTTCVDSGAVQTNYALAFTTEPPLTVDTDTAFGAEVGLTESGAAASAVANAVAMTDAASILGGTTSASFSGGSAVFSGLTVSAPYIGDSLTATLALNPALTPALNLTATSSSFNAIGTQTISFPTIASQVAGTTINLSATATSGLAVGFTSLTTSVCTVSGATAALISYGHCTIEATQPGDTGYLAATPVSQTFSVSHATQTITFGPIGNQTAATIVKLAASASSLLPVTFTSLSPTICTASGSIASLIAAGFCTIQASQAGNDVFLGAVSVNQQFGVGHAAQTISFPAITGSHVAATTLGLSATASSGLPVAFASTTPTICTVSGTTASLIGEGFCTIEATQNGNNAAGNSEYFVANPVFQTFGVGHASQTISFPAIGNKTAATTVNLVATASSGLTVSFASATPAVCTVSGTVASLIAEGFCWIDASQAGDGEYFPAPTVGQQFGVGHAYQTITYAPSGPLVAASTVNLNPKASSGLPVTLTSTTPSVCTISGSNATLLTYGFCVVDASVAGNKEYFSATSSTTFGVGHASQTIAFPAIPTQYVGLPLTLSATASSELAVTFTSTTQTVCTVSGTTASFIATGTCTIVASQAGNSTYGGAINVSRSFTVDPN